MSTQLSSIRREHVETFIESLLQRFKATTGANLYAGLHAFFKWAVDEGEIRDSPMVKMRKPKMEEYLTPVLTDAEIKALLVACKGDDYAARRDTAIIRLFLGTGARLSEVAGLRWNPNDPTSHDVELDQGIVRIMGKGRRERVVHMGAKAAQVSIPDDLREQVEKHLEEHPVAPWDAAISALADGALDAET